MSKKSNAEKIAAKKVAAAETILITPVTQEPKPIEYETKLGWFFATNDNRLRYGDNREIVVGETHTVEFDENSEPSLCSKGLHASPKVIDAFNYAPGTNLYRVSVDGIRIKDKQYSFWDMYWSDNKFVGKSRTYIAHINASSIIERRCRELVVKSVKHQKINLNSVLQAYLDTGENAHETLKHMVALNLNDEHERMMIDLIWHLLQADITPDGYAKVNLIKENIREIYRLEEIKSADFDELDDLFLKEMNLSEEHPT